MTLFLAKEMEDIYYNCKRSPLKHFGGKYIYMKIWLHDSTDRSFWRDVAYVRV